MCQGWCWVSGGARAGGLERNIFTLVSSPSRSLATWERGVQAVNTSHMWVLGTMLACFLMMLVLCGCWWTRDHYRRSRAEPDAATTDAARAAAAKAAAAAALPQWQWVREAPSAAAAAPAASTRARRPQQGSSGQQSRASSRVHVQNWMGDDAFEDAAHPRRPAESTLV